MKKTILTLFTICLCLTNTFAQEWLTDFETAKNKSKTEDKAILLVFQGSDWCVPCMKLDKKIWSSKEFIEGYSKHFILLVADFPRKKKNALSKEQTDQNKLLAEKYNKKGYFPLVVVLDNEGKVLGETGYNKLEPNEYLQSLITFTN